MLILHPIDEAVLLTLHPIDEAVLFGSVVGFRYQVSRYREHHTPFRGQDAAKRKRNKRRRQAIKAARKKAR